MIPAADFKEISRLVMQAMKRDRLINLFWSRADYERAIGAKVLSYTPLAEGIALWLDRGTHLRLYFIMNGKDPLPPLPKTAVTEWVLPASGKIALPLCFTGWEQLFTRLRLSRAPQNIPMPLQPAEPADPAQLSALMQLLENCFDPLTGCLPNQEELRQDLAEENILCVRDGEEPLAILHFKADAKKAEIRHFAVAECARGQGWGNRLLQTFLALHGEKPCTVWVRSGNEAALHLYEKYGFSADGRTSVVLTKGKER